MPKQPRAVPGQPLTRKIPSSYDEGEMVEIDTYQEKHWPQNQELVAGRFPLNPILREWFDDTSNEQRENLEVEHWWDLPFIMRDTWEDQEAHFRSHQATLRAELWDRALSEAEVEAQLPGKKATWLASWPAGERFEVRCLDGGAWDRSTSWGMFPTLEAAVAVCEAGPVWRETFDKQMAALARTMDQDLTEEHAGDLAALDDPQTYADVPAPETRYPLDLTLAQLDELKGILDAVSAGEGDPDALVFSILDKVRAVRRDALVSSRVDAGQAGGEPKCST